MNKYLTSSQLKQNARKQLFGNIGTVFGAFLMYTMLVIAISCILVDSTHSGLIGIIITFIFAMISGLFKSLLTTGMSFLSLKLSCGQEAEVFDVFYGLRQLKIKTILIRIIPVTISAAISIPMSLAANNLLTQMPENDALMEMMKRNDINELYEFVEKMTPLYNRFFGTFFLFLAINIIIKILFSQTYFLMLDYVEKTPLEIIKLGFKVMKGSWIRYFGLMLSFIPWYLLASVTCSISMVYSEPYRSLTYANFYMDLMKNYGSSQAKR